MSKARITQLEIVLEDCIKFLELVPLTQIEKGIRWMPSEEAIMLGKRAKDAINQYSQTHLHPIRNS